MDVLAWLNARGGIARRTDLLRAGFSRGSIARAGLVSAGRLWRATPTAPPELVAAAAERGRLTCVSAAQYRGLALLHPPARAHLQVAPGRHIRRGADLRWHWDQPILPARADSLLASVPDMLAHVARCLPHDEALVVWESAARQGLLRVAELGRIRWGSPTERALAAETGGDSDSLIETLAVDALRHAGIAVRQQVTLLGRPVDALVGDALVLQFDGQEFHASPAARSRDAAHDARLRLEGYTVLRFTYADIVYRRHELIDRVRHAMAQGLHCAA